MPKPNVARKLSADSSASAKNDGAPKRTPKSKQLAHRSAKSPLTEAPAPRSSGKKSKSRHPRRQPSLERLPIDEALRREGMGESDFAKSLGEFMRAVGGRKRNPKLMLDGLKEWARHFQTKRPPESAAANDVPVIVQLVHHVQRPARPPLEIPAPPPPPEIDS